MVLEDYQFYKGYTIFLCKQHVSELHELGDDFKMQFLKEMSLVAQAVFECFSPQKLNYELLGNSCPHLHWHIIPRYPDDPDPKNPIWETDGNIRRPKDNILKAEECEILKSDLLKEINNLKRQKEMGIYK